MERLLVALGTSRRPLLYVGMGRRSGTRRGKPAGAVHPKRSRANQSKHERADKHDKLKQASATDESKLNVGTNTSESDLMRFKK